MAFTPQDLADHAAFVNAYWGRNPSVRAARENAARTKSVLDKLLAPKPAPLPLVVAPNAFTTVYVSADRRRLVA